MKKHSKSWKDFKTTFKLVYGNFRKVVVVTYVAGLLSGWIGSFIFLYLLASYILSGP